MQAIADANAEALRRTLTGEPVLVDVVPAREALPALKPSSPGAVARARSR